MPPSRPPSRDVTVDGSIGKAIRLLQEGRAGEAVEACRRLLEGVPATAAAHHVMARALLALRRDAEALRHLRRADALDPGAIPVSVDLAQAYVRQGKPDEAETVLRRAMAAAPDDVGLLNNLGSLLADRGSPTEGAELLARAVALQPETAVLHYNLANAMKRSERLEPGVAHYRRAAELQPNLHAAWHNLGNLLIDLGRTAEAAEAFEVAFRLKRQPGGPERPPENFTTTRPSKLLHDIEQFQYLIGRGILPAEAGKLVGAYQAALADLPAEANGTAPVAIPPAHRDRLRPTYNRLVHRQPAPRLPGPAVNPFLDRAAIETDYARNAPGYTYVDRFLTDEALEKVRRFCLGSTIWYAFRYANGYLGAFMDDGFCSPLLLQIAEELRQALPAIFRDHALRKLWAFKYDSRLSGIPIHADFAAVNVNFWITPDQANLDPNGGGLIFWDRQAPLDWDFETYNANEPAIRRFLAETGARPVAVPHRQNRVVIFNSALFHQTGAIRFREGYENRRINITMLFGRRGE